MTKNNGVKRIWENKIGKMFITTFFNYTKRYF